jgi:hypothetical protein
MMPLGRVAWLGPVIAAAVSASPAHACSHRPRAWTQRAYERVSDVILLGRLTGSALPHPEDGQAVFTGFIEPLSVTKGARLARYPVRHELMEFYCSGGYWEPKPGAAFRRNQGTFYLRRHEDGTFAIYSFRRS